MANTYGMTFRKLRRNREITLNEIGSETGLSKSFISRFERGESEISLKNFLKLLGAINVGYIEFFTETALSDFPANVPITSEIKENIHLQELPFMSGFAKMRSNSSFDKENYQQILQPLITEAEQEYRRLPNKRNHFQWLFYRCVYETIRIGNSDPQQQAAVSQIAAPVSHYLQNVDNWGLYEIYLFQFFAIVLPYQANLRLLKIGMKKSRQLTAARNFEDLPFALLVTDFTIFLAYHHIEEARETLTMMKQQPTDNATDKIAIFFYEGWLQLKLGNTALGTQQCQHAIQLFQELDLPEIALGLRQNLKVILDGSDGLIILNLR